MGKKQMSFTPKGMNRDLSVSKFNPEFAFENRNLRLSTNEGNTMLSWVNEKGPKKLEFEVTSEVKLITGTPIGNAVINDLLVLFTTTNISDTDLNTATNPDYIYLIKYNGDKTKLIGKELFNGNLKFSVKYPLETLVSYESEAILKVYWVDGINQTRSINIAKKSNTYYKLGKPINTAFDFIVELELKEQIHITKYEGGQGIFPAGVIQYSFTYFNKYGLESNIFYTTPLHYISYLDRAAASDDKVPCIFKIEISNYDLKFDYLRIYSIIRTSINGTPIVKRVQDIAIPTGSTTLSILSFIDTNTTGEAVDPTYLLYLGGENVIALTLEQKDNTLFLGNLKIDRITKNLDVASKLLALNGVSRVSKDFPLIQQNVTPVLDERPFTLGSKGDINWICTLSCPDGLEYKRDKTKAYYEGASAFKSREYYRLGILFQYKTGKWSDPYWIGDKQWDKATNSGGTQYGPLLNYSGGEDTAFEGAECGILALPEFVYTLKHEDDATEDIQTIMYNAGYRRVRAVYAQPSIHDRTILCQGIICPTVFREGERDSLLSYAQSSWLFRAPIDQTKYVANIDDPSTTYYLGAVASDGFLPTIYYNYDWYDTGTPAPGYGYNIKEFEILGGKYHWLGNYRSTEIMGVYPTKDRYQIDNNFGTVHSPEVELDDNFITTSLKGSTLYNVGNVGLTSTYGAINIQTSTPTISDKGRGFLKDYALLKSIGTSALISGNYYEDHFVIAEMEDNKLEYRAMYRDYQPYLWPIFMWHRKGALNNDVLRENSSSKLLRKRISNYRYADGVNYHNKEKINYADARIFSSLEASQIIKVDGKIYLGCVDVVLSPEYSDIFATGLGPSKGFDEDASTMEQWVPQFTDLPMIKSHQNKITDSSEWLNWWLSILLYKGVDEAWHTNKDWKAIPTFNTTLNGVYRWNPLGGEYEKLGNIVSNLGMFKEVVPIKYKSSPHIAVKLNENVFIKNLCTDSLKRILPENLAVVEFTNDYQAETFYGGTSDDALLAISWIPCGPATDLNTKENIEIKFKWGDCYFLRYECLKTYPYTSEDINQVIEIGSFMMETRVNLDGRYDTNRGLLNNTHINTQNFNLINSAYSQLDNFFAYKIYPEDYYINTEYPNQITWTKTKSSGSDIDAWTNITLASILELDGNIGKVNKLTKFNDLLFAFLDNGISLILYNDNILLSTLQGIPIEIANSGKVTGKRYFSNIIGCDNKYSIVKTSNGVYFIDSNDKNIYLLDDNGLSNLSSKLGVSTWCKINVPDASVKWDPLEYNTFTSYYDRVNLDVLFINKNLALAYSERFGTFTSFYDYGGTPYFCNLLDTGIWIKPVDNNNTYNTELWKHNAGEYCKFFSTSESKPYSMTLVGNPEPLLDKIFTNLEFRATIEGEGDTINNRYQPYVPFDSLEAWNEYQHGLTSLLVKDGHDSMVHDGLSSSLLRKFRIWRCDIPRNNYEWYAYPVKEEGETEEEYQSRLAEYNEWYNGEVEKGISRHIRKPMDRMRNPWIYLKLKKGKDTSKKVEIHDIMMTYFT